MRSFILFLGFFVSHFLGLKAQIANTATMDTSDVKRGGKFVVGGYVDAYYGYSSSSADGNVFYMVTAARQNEVNINLAYIDAKYTSERIRARVVPALGAYMNANYTNEPQTLKHLLEGSAGVCLSQKRGIWLDVGVLGSPYTNESAISKDHLVYTRSLLPEYVPYYLSGAKLSMPLNPKLSLSLYLLNGWQVIVDNNKQKSLGTQLEYRPNSKTLLNWNTYIGDERSVNAPNNRMRYFSDVFILYNPSEKFNLTACVYGGLQKRADSTQNAQTNHFWAAANITTKYFLTKKASISSRLEYFKDRDLVQITPANPLVSRFSTWGASLCFNYQIVENAVFRLEARGFYSEDKIFQNFKSQFSNAGAWFVSNLTVWF